LAVQRCVHPFLGVVVVTIIGVLLAQGQPKKNNDEVPKILLTSRYVYVEAIDGDVLDPRVLPENRNTLNCNHPIVEKLIVECLRYWVKEAHVDGFRFDEGSILSRGEDGAPTVHPPLAWQVELDEDLMDTKLIAEAWDAAGLYQIGHFPGDRWGE
jgi:hypothetical protein